MRPLAVLAACIATAVCGGESEPRSRIWLTSLGGSLHAVGRDVPPRPSLVLRALLAGPTPSEQDRGVTTDLPPGTELFLAASLRGGTVRAYLRGPGLDPYEPSSTAFALRLAQLVYTLTELPRVERVQLVVNGCAWGFETHAGRRITTYTRATAPYVCEGRIWVGEPPAGCPEP